MNQLELHASIEELRRLKKKLIRAILYTMHAEY
jgi:hypothetical protein